MKEYRRMLQKNPKLLDISDRAYALAGEEAADAAVCMYVLWPVLMGFVSWTLMQAQNSGVKRLYFLARDGWMMRRIAEEICLAWELPVECRYLYVSRYSLQIPENHLIGEKSLERICRNGMHVTFHDMMARAGLSEEESLQIAESIGFGEDPGQPLTKAQIRGLYEPLAECREFETLEKRRSRERYREAAAYLRQEGMLDEVPWAIVDSGWIGTMQESLQHLLDSMGFSKKVKGYYFGLYGIPQDMESAQYSSWYFGPKDHLKRKSCFSNCLLESVFSAPHGMTLGYEKKDGRMAPVLAETFLRNREKLVRQRTLMDCCMKAWRDAGAPDAFGRGGGFPKELETALISFMLCPSREEAAYYGGSSFCDDITEKRAEALAGRMTQMQLFGNHLLLRPFAVLSRKKKDSAWIEGSICLYGGGLKGWHRLGILACKSAVYLRMQYRNNKRK